MFFFTRKRQLSLFKSIFFLAGGIALLSQLITKNNFLAFLTFFNSFSQMDVSIAWLHLCMSLYTAHDEFGQSRDMKVINVQKEVVTGLSCLRSLFDNLAKDIHEVQSHEFGFNQFFFFSFSFDMGMCDLHNEKWTNSLSDSALIVLPLYCCKGTIMRGAAHLGP